MQVKVGTFNLNNLFSRFNFKASINQIATGGAMVSYEFSNPAEYVIRKYMGRLIDVKGEENTRRVAARIKAMDCDVLAVQEVEDIYTLRQFNQNYLGGLYPHQVLIEGNDKRLIDVGLLSKYPVGAITSHQTAVHKSRPETPIFSRDLLQVQILDANRNRTLFTLFNTHLKSHFGDDDEEGLDANELRRRQQAEMVAQIIADQTRPSTKYMLVGDMNDAPEAAALKPMLFIEGNRLVNALANPLESRPSKKESSGHEPHSPAWTHRYLKNGVPEHRLYDQIWLSPGLATGLISAHIDRRERHGGDGSDHDPAWIVLDI